MACELCKASLLHGSVTVTCSFAVLAPQHALCSLLKQHGLTLKDGHGFLEASNFCLSSLCALSISLRLGDATSLEALVVVIDCVELLLHCATVTTGFARRLVETL